MSASDGAALVLGVWLAFLGAAALLALGWQGLKWLAKKIFDRYGW